MGPVREGDDQLCGLLLRYAATVVLLEAGRPLELDEVLHRLEADGFRVRGRPSKTLSDALRWEVRRGRVVPVSRGLYRAGSMPRQTKSRIRRRVELMRRRGVRAAAWSP